MSNPDNSPITDTKQQIPPPEELDQAIKVVTSDKPDSVFTQETTSPAEQDTNNLPIKDEAEDKPFDMGKALTLRLKNNTSYGDISKLLNCPKTTVWQRLKPFEDLISHPEAVNAYNDNRALLLTAAEFNIIKEIANEEKVKSGSINNLGYVLDKLNNMRRLELDKSTANYSHHILSEKISELDREEAQIRAELEGNWDS